MKNHVYLLLFIFGLAVAIAGMFADTDALKAQPKKYMPCHSISF